MPARQGCRGALDRARFPTYCVPGDVHELLPRPKAAGPFAVTTSFPPRMMKLSPAEWAGSE